MAKLADISKATNLGLGTVSDILRHKPGYSDQTRRRVLKMAAKLNYRPNLIGQALQRGRTRSIGLIGGSLTTPISSLKLDAIVKAAQNSGYACFLGQPSFEKPEIDPKVVDGILDRAVDGLIVYFAAAPKDPILQRLESVAVPTVYLDWAPPWAKYYVAINRSAGIRQAARHLARLGHRRAKYIATTSDVYNPSLKIDGYRRAFAEEGIELEGMWETVIDPAVPYVQSAHLLIRQLIASGQLPTALLMNNDLAALGALAALRDAGLQVPRDISLVGFDDIPQAAYYRPSLTTIAQPRQEAGRAAFEMLETLMNDESVEHPRVQFDCRLVQRQSTGPVRSTGRQQTKVSQTPSLFHRRDR